MSSRPVLGGFTLDRVLGRGAMGEVWLGRHQRSDATAAVKVVTASLANDPAYHRVFRGEVRSMAGLDHPGIIRVFDYGEVSSSEADGCAKEEATAHIAEGSPYLAMEVLEGDLDPTGGPRWPWLRRLLLDVLDALAHSHARGVIHRDLKPGNILARADGSACLVDFGLAHVGDEVHVLDAQGMAVGTPAYMAPEQIRAQRREFGPWTDLYAVGCVAFRLATGATPFPLENEDVRAVMVSHLYDEPPPLAPRFPVPEGFDEWVARLLEKEPAWRFRRAADAAWALTRLSAVTDDGADGVGIGTGEFPAMQSVWRELSEVPSETESESDERTRIVGRSPAALRVEAATTNVATAETSAPIARARPEGLAFIDPVPPFPPRWYDARDQTDLRPQLAGVGLGVFALREPPLIGRHGERTQLWRALQEVFADGVAQAVVVRGPSGCGKSRLASWLAGRGHEAGVCEVVRAVHSPLEAAGDGLGPMLARFLRVGGVSGPDLHDVVVERLDEIGIDDNDEIEAVVSAIDSAAQGSFRSPAERHRLIRRVLSASAWLDRPLVVWLDDAQWGLDALAFARHVLSAQAATPAPLLLVLTIRDEAVDDTAADHLRELSTQAGARELPLEPLDQEESRNLTRTLLGFDSSLAAELTARSVGNPLFAIHLVNDWIERELLVAGPRGFELREGADVRLPNSLHEIWLERLEAIFAEEDPSVWLAVELAAALGQDIDGGEWHGLCGNSGIEASLCELARERLLERGLARANVEDGDDWSFAHGMLRETLERRAVEADRFESHHRACARVISERGGLRSRERLGRHLAEAGDLQDALQPLIDGAQERVDGGDYDQTELLLSRCETIIEGLGLDEGDPRVVDVLSARAWHARLAEEHPASAAYGERAVAAARAGGWPRVRARALLAMARVERNRGDLDAGWTLSCEAFEALEDVDAPHLLARCNRGMGILCMVRADLDEAAGWLSQAHEMFLSCGPSAYVDVAICLQALSVVLNRLGKAEESLETIDRAMTYYERAGSRYWKANCINDRADFMRRMGHIEEGERGYREAIRIFETLGINPVIPRVNLGALHVEREEFAEGINQLRAATDELESQRRRGLLSQVLVYILPCYAGLGDWDSFSTLLTEVEPLLAETEVVSVDVARFAELAARTCVDASAESGHEGELNLLELADRSAAISVSQWQRLQRQDDQARASALVAEIAASRAPDAPDPPG